MKHRTSVRSGVLVLLLSSWMCRAQDHQVDSNARKQIDAANQQWVAGEARSWRDASFYEPLLMRVRRRFIDEFILYGLKCLASVPALPENSGEEVVILLRRAYWRTGLTKPKSLSQSAAISSLRVSGTNSGELRESLI